METFAIISNPGRFLKRYQNCLYISTALGNPKLEEDDYIGKKIKELNLEYDFNINEMFILRSFDSRKFCVYVPMTHKLYYIAFSQKVFGVNCSLPNIIVCLLDNTDYVVMDIQKLTYHVYVNFKRSFDAYLLLSQDFSSSTITTPITLSSEDNLYLPFARTITNVNVKKKIKSEIQFNTIKFNFDMMLACFFLNDEKCIAIENDEKIINFISLNDKTYVFSNWEFFEFLDLNFYNQVKNRTFIKK